MIKYDPPEDSDTFERTFKKLRTLYIAMFMLYEKLENNNAGHKRLDGELPQADA